MRRRPVALKVIVASALIVGGPSLPARAAGDWAWPVIGPVIRGFDPPDSPYGAGHRGIDIAAAQASVVVAAADGAVSFAGAVGGRLFVTVDHGGGWTSTYSWVSVLLVRKGAHVSRGQPVALSGWGHVDATVPHLHIGVRLDGEYVDPLLVLAPPDVSGMIRLAPL
jgi:murein DD-endopeptidase MepM/ murein hydrolase activator NlpD